MFSSPEDKNKLWPQYLAALSALFAMFCSGIHFGWPSPSLPRILSEEYPLNVTSEEASYITIIAPLGGIAGAILSSLLVDTIGRKSTILLIGGPQILSMVMIYLSDYSKILLYFARFSGGISEGACFTILPIYTCEVSEPKIRGLLGASFSLNMMLGILFVNFVGSYLKVTTSALIFLACSVLFLLVFSFMPESPYYLIMKKRTENARQALRKLRGRTNIEVELSGLIEDVQRQMSEPGGFADLWDIKSNKRAALVMGVLRVLQQLSGVSSFTFYAQILFKEATDAIPEHWAAILMIAIQTVFTLLAVLLVDVVGRKPLILTSVGGCCLALIFNGIFFTLKDLSSIDVNTVNIIPLFGLIGFMIFFATGLGSAVNLLLGELFPASVKAKALCIMNVVMSVTMLASTKFYQYMADNVSIAVPFWIFAACQFLGFIFSVKYMPETMNKTLEQIQQELKGNQRNQEESK